MKWLRRIILVFLIIFVLAALAGWGVAAYIAPQEELDLTAPEINLKQKAIDMALQMKPELIITEAELNYVLISYLRSQTQLTEDITLQGARLELSNDLLIAHMNITYRELLPAAVRAEYRLLWEPPNLRAVPERIAVRAIPLPIAGLEELVIPIGTVLPEWLEIQTVQFEPKQLRVRFMANLPDLNELLDRLN